MVFEDVAHFAQISTDLPPLTAQPDDNSLKKVKFWRDVFNQQSQTKTKKPLFVKAGEEYTTSIIDTFPLANPALVNEDFQFTHSPIMNEVHVERIGKSMELQEALKSERNWTNLFVKDLIWRLGKGHKNVIVIGYGATGVGKSSVSQFWGLTITQLVNQIMGKRLEHDYGRLAKFDVSNICFSRTDFLKRVETAIRGEVIIFDEDENTAIGMGSVRQRDELEQVEKVTRAEQFNFWYNSPVIENHNEHFMIKGLDSSFSHALDRAVLYIKDNNGMYEAYAHLITSHTIIDGYTERKNEYIKKVQLKTTNELYAEYENTAREILEFAPKIFYKVDSKSGEKTFDAKFKVQLAKAIIRKQYPKFAETEYKEVINAIYLLHIDIGDLVDNTSKLEDFVEEGDYD